MTSQTQNRPIREFFRSNWKDLGLLTVVGAAALTGAGMLIRQDFRIGHLEEDVKEWEQRSRSFEETAREVQSLKKWVSCQEKEERSGNRHEFYWTTLECIEYPEKSVPTKVSP